MRTYGRTTDQFGNQKWVEVDTDSQGFDDMVWVTTLAQNLKLNLGESPFYADWGIPARQSVATQVYPDFYVALTQQRFAPHFAALVVTRVPVVADPKSPHGAPPTYRVSVLTHSGVKLLPITIPTSIPT